MALSSDLISQFVKVTNDNAKVEKDSTAYGTIVESNGSFYVRIDGSEILTPMSKTSKVKHNDRVVITIKNQSVIVTGNITDPSASNKDVTDVKNTVDKFDLEGISNKISEFEIIIADAVTAKELDVQIARIDDLRTDHAVIRQGLDAANANIETLQTDNATVNEILTANEADISSLKTDKIDATVARAEFAKIAELEATNADLHNLEATYGEFADLTTNKFSATDASIADLQAKKLSATDIEGKYANIDFSNIGVAAITKFFATSGLIKDVVVGNGTITGKLVGVTITGDLIEGGTVVADKLVIKGEDGLYYKLNTDGVTTEAEQTEYNSLNGSVITAKSITATKIAVDDLVAFDATIGGFNITESAIYSGVKNSVTNTTAGIYLSRDGQLAVGDGSNFVKFYKDTNGTYKLAISADSILFGNSKKSVEKAIDDVQTSVDNIKVGGRNLLKNSRHVKLSSNNSNVYPITSEMLTEDGREFTRYSRTEPDLSPTIMSLYSAIPTNSIVENLTGKEMTFSVLIRCSHETTTTVMSMLRIDGETFTWASNTAEYQIGTSWKRIFVTATIEQEYEWTVSNLLGFNPLNITIPEGEIDNFYVDVCEWKIEKGNKATDWTPAPEDMATSMAVDTAQTVAEDAKTLADTATTLIAQLSESISMLVTDGNGTSLMTQTEEGWTFSTADIMTAVNNTSQGLNSLTEELGDTISVVSVLQQTMNDIGTIAEYVKISTYEDEPCIELGEGDSNFKLLITNTRIMFMDGSDIPAYINNKSLYIKKAVIEEELHQGGYAWVTRSNGHLSLVWKGAAN